jgi:hypothetical protein
MNRVHVFDTLAGGTRMELDANEYNFTEGINSSMHHVSSSTDTATVHPVPTSVESPDEDWTFPAVDSSECHIQFVLWFLYLVGIPLVLIISVYTLVVIFSSRFQ